MIGSALIGVRRRQWAACWLGLLICAAAQPAAAADCPGHPDALGTSRTLVVDPQAHRRIGAMQYPETLPLQDHEVVLTFDDGPLPRNSNQVLEILAAQCVKATFFTIGSMARAYPEGVRKLRDAGHSIGTHSQDHPLTMDRMSIERARQEIDDGIASVKSALGDDAALAPFFRIPGLARAEAVEGYLASLGIQTWSADFLADDWRHISSSRVYELAIKRLEDRGRGVLLLHDIQARTVAALPRILHELKARGYRIVHVVPATPEQPATPTEPQQWQLHPVSEYVATSHWPKIRNFVFAAADMLPAPALSDMNWHDGQLMPPAELPDRARRGVPLPREAPWPPQLQLAADSEVAALPIPAQNIFEIQEGSYAAIALPSHHAEQPVRAEGATGEQKLTSADAGESRAAAGKHHGRARKLSASHTSRRGTRLAGHGGRHAQKHAVQVKKLARGVSVRNDL
jgi:peptidoglycan/xylan/chitin deacetylase (PgdA/CDA1 family)